LVSPSRSGNLDVSVCCYFLVCQSDYNKRNNQTCEIFVSSSQ
jgi:hypothetical protein